MTDQYEGPDYNALRRGAEAEPANQLGPTIEKCFARLIETLDRNTATITYYATKVAEAFDRNTAAVRELAGTAQHPPGWVRFPDGMETTLFTQELTPDQWQDLINRASAGELQEFAKGFAEEMRRANGLDTPDDFDPDDPYDGRFPEELYKGKIK